MKNCVIWMLFFDILLLSSFIYSDDFMNCNENYDHVCSSKFTLEAKCAAVIPFSSRVRRIYGPVLPEFTVEGNLKLSEVCCGDLYLWLDGSYIFASGHSYGYE